MSNLYHFFDFTWITLSVVYTHRWRPCLVCGKHRNGSQVSRRLGGPGRHSRDLHGWAGCARSHLAVYRYVGGLAIDPLLKMPSCSLVIDPHPVIHFWALKPLSMLPALVTHFSCQVHLDSNAAQIMLDLHKREGGLRGDHSAFKSPCKLSTRPMKQSRVGTT